VDRIRADDYKVDWANKVKPAELEWLLEPFIPMGMLTVATGDTGIGKSTFLIDVIARLTRGKAMPSFDDAPASGSPRRGSALILNKEDSPEHIIVPRLRAAGADLERVGFVGKHSRWRNSHEPIDALDEGVRELEAKIREAGDVAMILIDPITSFVGKKGITQDNTRRRGAACARERESRVLQTCWLALPCGQSRWR
jgi:putative DNA primase/helicase